MADVDSVRLLCMEDDFGHARIIIKNLERRGYVVDHAADGRQGLKVYSREKHDLVIVDQKMPEYDGLEVIGKFLERGYLPPLIMLTGTGNEKIAVQAMKLGAGDYIVKDVEGGYIELLPAVIEEVLEQRRILEAKQQAERELKEHRAHLEELVGQRTIELKQLNEKLQREIAERQQAEEERNRLQEQVYQAQKLESLGVLAGGIAHDFNNLLVGILGNASLALLELDENSPAFSSVQQIETAASRAADLTRQLLAYSGKGRFIVGTVHLSRLVEEMTHLLEITISKKIEVRFALDPAIPPVECDATQLRQVIMNLITNASEAIGDAPGTITIETGVMEADAAFLQTTCLSESAVPGRYAFIRVSDTGCGMDKETLDRIFDPFFTTKFTGRGLGLAAVLGIARGEGGTIKVTSEPGAGSSFQFLIPRALSLAIAPVPERKKETPDWKGRGTILVVDDENAVRSVAKKMLERCGFRVLTAHDGREGVEVFQKNASKIDLVVLDMTMPYMSGEETYRALREIKRNVRVILSSGYSEQETTGLFQPQGLAGFIQKPYKHTALLEKIRTVLIH